MACKCGQRHFETGMNNLVDLLVTARSCYREVLQAYAEVDISGLAADGKSLERLLAQMEPKLAAAHVADQALRNYLDGAGSSDHHLPLMCEYRDLLAQVAERNQVLLGQARTHRALVLAEISELQAGKTALAGYRLPAEKSGQRLSEAY